MRSADGQVIAHIGEGKIAGQKVKQTWLLTPLRNGRVIVTSDDFDEGDSSGTYINYRLIGADFRELLKHHLDKVKHNESPVSPMEEADVRDAYEAVLRGRTKRLIEKGRANWTSDQQTHWRYSLWGAVLICFGFFPQLLTGLTQIHRVGRK